MHQRPKGTKSASESSYTDMTEPSITMSQSAAKRILEILKTEDAELPRKVAIPT
jgi:hypothetical protein